jgi:hypothetical protein
MPVVIVTGRPRFHLQVELGEGESVGRGGVVCIALEAAARLRARELMCLAWFSICRVSTSSTPSYLSIRYSTACSLFVETSWQTRRGTFDALSREARRLKGITLHGSAPARHQYA